MIKLVLLRHGESHWNWENKFTGWTDIDLSEKGRQEAKNAGQLLKEDGYRFDIAFTSLLVRAIRTGLIVLDELSLLWIPIERSWRLNERHYGALQGLNKAQTAARHGDVQTKIWRRSYDIPPPALTRDDPRHPSFDPRYSMLSPEELPNTESLKNVVDRFLPYWHEVIAPTIVSGKRPLIVGHNNSLRALVMFLDRMSESDIVDVNIPTGIPLVYELDEALRPIRHYYLGDPEAAKSAAERVARETEATRGPYRENPKRKKAASSS